MKIAINGCGIGGPALAWWLKKYGFEPVIFEKSAALRSGGYIIDFWGSGFDIVEKMGILPALREDSYSIGCVRTVDETGKSTSEIDASVISELTGGRYFSIARSDLSKRIFDACKSPEIDVETRFGLAIDKFEDKGNTVEVQLSDGTVEAFDLVIGADGLHSHIRQLAFGPQDRFEHHLGYYVAAFTIPGYQPRDELTFVSHTKPGRYIARASLRDDQTLILMVFDKRYVDEIPSNEKSEKALVREIFGDMGWEAPAILAKMDEVDDIYFDRVSQIKMQSWTKGRIVLLGDAAACPSLLSGEGTGLAITEAYVLAGELKRANGNHSQAFASYENLLFEHLQKKQKAALRFAGYFSPKNDLSLFARDMMMRIVSIPFLAKRVFSSSFRTDIKLPDY